MISKNVIKGTHSHSVDTINELNRLVENEWNRSHYRIHQIIELTPEDWSTFAFALQKDYRFLDGMQGKRVLVVATEDGQTDGLIVTETDGKRLIAGIHSDGEAPNYVVRDEDSDRMPSGVPYKTAALE